MGDVHLYPISPTQKQMQAVEKASNADRRWFAEHPGRNHRMRRPAFGEAPAHPDMLTFILVKQVRPGFRLRTAIYADTPPPGEADEAAAACLWAEATRGAEVADG
jgi:hypothetical protein